MMSSTVENYLKAIYMQLQAHDGELLPFGKLAQSLGVTAGTVTTMVKALAQAGHVTYQARQGVSLTESGEKSALRVMRRHRLVEQFLVEVVGLDWSEVHDDAEVLEHAISDRLLDRIDQMLGYPLVDPHGEPIPQASGKISRRKLVPLSTCKAGAATIGRVDDHSPRFLHFLQEQDLIPGRRVEVVDWDDVSDAMTLRTANDDAVHVGLSAAEKIFVTVDKQAIDQATKPKTPKRRPAKKSAGRARQAARR